MSAYSTSTASEHGGDIADWEQLITDAIGAFIEFWGFKRNHGRVWAYLYLRGRPHTAGEIQQALELSKGAVSMITRELERWGVLHRLRGTGDAAACFEAETELGKMIRSVLAEREAGIVRRVRDDLDRAEELARESGNLSWELRDRITRIASLARFADSAMELFLKTSVLDVTSAMDILKIPEDGERRP